MPYINDLDGGAPTNIGNDGGKIFNIDVVKGIKVPGIQGLPTVNLEERSFTGTSVLASGSGSASSDDGGISEGVSFVGNTTSTVLFFLALAVGVLIAILFVFFTFRYFIRSKYGLHVYPIPHRGLFVASNTSINRSEFTNGEIQEQINYIRDNNYIRGEILTRRINRGRNRRRRRGGRYSRMKKLTEQEIEILFPKKTYHDWLNGGQERDHEIRDGVLQEESLLASATHGHNGEEDDTFELNDSQEENLNQCVTHTSGDERIEVNVSPITKVEGIEMQNLKLDEIPHATHVSSAEEEEAKEELHFTSGTCAICLEILENDDNVRGLICGHVFHSDCLDPWLTRRRACCPMCKRDYFFKDEHNNSLSQNGEASSTSHNHDDDNEGDDGIDYEAFRNDPTLTALLQELIPITERVRLILSDTSLASLNIEQRADEIAVKKRSNAFKVVWWKIMGISKQDLFNWAVITIHRDYRQSLSSNATDNEDNADTNINADANANADTNTNTASDSDTGAGAEANSDPANAASNAVVDPNLVTSNQITIIDSSNGFNGAGHRPSQTPETILVESEPSTNVVSGSEQAQYNLNSREDFVDSSSRDITEQRV